MPGDMDMPLSLRLSRRRFLGSCAAMAIGSAGCGTILHPERRGQPAGELDWGIVALDAIGLFFFFIPGVIAFAVDFSNGTIYLPPRHYGEFDGDARPGRLRRVNVPRESLTREGIADVVGRHTGRPVELRAGDYETVPMTDVDEFWPAYRERLAEKRAG
jgi:hypothetical protein